MDDHQLSLVITSAASVLLVLSAWAGFWVWRARHGGWARLAATYPAGRKPDVGARRRQSLCLMPAGINYPACVTLRLSVDGLYAVPGLPVRFGHDPVLVPWDDIEILAVDTYPADRLYDLKFARLPQVRMRVGVAVAQLVRRAADNSQYFLDGRQEPQDVAAAATHVPPPAAGQKSGLRRQQSVA